MAKQRFRKRPVVVEAQAYEQGLEDRVVSLRIGEMSSEVLEIAKAWYGDVVQAAVDLYASADTREEETERWPRFQLPYLKTLEGNHFIRPTDFIVTGVAGERYPVKKEIFECTYELAPDGALPKELEEADARLTQLVRDYQERARFVPATRSLLADLSTRWEAGERTLRLVNEIMNAPSV